MTAAPLLELDAVRIRHDGLGAGTPDGVSLDIHAGEVVLVLGPSGCGKSTLALALDGLVPHAVPAELEGTVRVAGARHAGRTVAELSEHVAMVFQDPDAQVVTGTLLDEVAFGPENRLIPAAEVLERAERALKLVGLWDRRADNPDALSGGGRQRLAIACALALAAPVLVLDEPTANLDPAGIDEVYAVLRELANERDHAIVLVEHNLDAAVDLVDRVIVLDAAGGSSSTARCATCCSGRAGELLELGVWLPVSTLAAMRLRAAGVADRPAAAHAVGARGGARRGRRRSHARSPRSPARRDDVATRGPRRRARGRVPSPCADRSVQRGGRRGPVVVDGVDLDVASGDFLAIVGTNGAGKTTLLQAIAGVIPAPRGTIDVLGIDPSRADARDRARRIGFVFQNPEHQFVAHTVAEELELGLRLQGVPEPDGSDEVERMLRALRPRATARPAPVPPLGRPEAAPLGRHRARRRRAGARARRADVRAGPRARRRAARHPARAQRRGHDRARRHPRPAARRRLRRPRRRHAGRTHARRRPDGRGARGPADRARPGCGIRRSRAPPAASSRHPEWQSVTRMSQLPARRTGGAARAPPDGGDRRRPTRTPSRRPHPPVRFLLRPEPAREARRARCP